MSIEVFEEYLKTLITMNHVEQWHPHGMTAAEYAYLYSVVVKRAPCNMLVFGIGLDGRLWDKANEGGNTVFLEDDKKWLAKPLAGLTILPVEYDTKRRDHTRLLKKFKKNKKILEMKLPDSVRDTNWDVILVDGPKNKKGRMKSIYAASVLGKNGSDILAHDCDRKIEFIYIKKFFKKKIHQVQMLGHYKVI